MAKSQDLDKLKMGDGEKIIKEGRGLYMASLVKNYSGRLYLTDRRLFFYGKFGSPLMPSKKHIVFDFQIEKVTKTSIRRSIVYSGGFRFLDIETKSDNARVTYVLGIDDWARAINNAISERSQKPPVIEAPPKPRKTLKQCSSCGGKFSEINFYKLKAGNDVECDFCGEIIES